MTDSVWIEFLLLCLIKVLECSEQFLLRNIGEAVSTGRATAKVVFHRFKSDTD